MLVERGSFPQERKFFADFIPEEFSQEERGILGFFFTNADKPVFAARNLPPTMIAALISRHSQTRDSMRRILLRYAKESGREGLLESIRNSRRPEDFLAMERADGLVRRSFVESGHDSLAATMPYVLGFENVSQLAAKAIEDDRVSVSPMERSTRYGFFGEKVGGRYQYARPPEIVASSCGRLYEQAIDAALDLYTKLQEPVAKCFRKKFPELPEGDIHRMVFDTTRVLLTAATFTNLGILVNGQAVEHLIIKLDSSPMREMQELGEMMQKEIAVISPALMERVAGEYGKRAIGYLSEREKRAEQLAGTTLEWVEPKISETETQLVQFDPDGEDKMIARMLWEKTNMSYQEVLFQVRKFTEEDKLAIICEYVGERPNRRIKLSRAFEESIMTFQIVCPFGLWRDLQRNRILTPSHQKLSYDWGIDIGEDLLEFGFREIVEEAIYSLADAYQSVSRRFPYEAQYLAAFAARMPYLITLNVRELCHLAEQRTDSGAHEGYAKIASDLARQALAVYPLFKKALQFVNWRE